MATEVLQSIDGAQADFGPATLQKVRRTLTSAEILDLFTTPITLVAAQVDKIYVPVLISLIFNYIAPAYGGGPGELRVGLTNNAITVIFASDFVGQTEDWFDHNHLGPDAGSGPPSGFANLPLSIWFTTANPTAGNGTLDVTVVYDEITVL